MSRGAAEAVFVEKNPKAMACIKENLKKTKLEDMAQTLNMDVMSALKKLDGVKKFDYVFMDPPYNQLLEKNVLKFLSQSDLLSADALIIVEASMETDFSYLNELGFSVIKRKEYKTNVHVFLERRNEPC